MARRRWALVLAGVGTLCALPALVGALPVNAGVVDPAQLRARILAAEVPYAGYAESAGSLGLPDLPAIGDVGGLLGGRTALRTWYASPTQWRVDAITPTGEHDLYLTPAGSVTWDYEGSRRTDFLGRAALRLPRAADLLPPALAHRLLGGYSPADQLRSIPARRVAGIAAPGLRLLPADPDSSVGALDVWADPRTGLALRVDITGRAGGAPSVTSQFLDLRQGPAAVSASVVTPPEPSGAHRSFADATALGRAIDRYPRTALPGRLAARDRSDLVGGDTDAVPTYGTGFAAFTVLQLPPDIADQVFDAVHAAQGSLSDLASGRAVVLRTALLTLVVALPAAGPDGFLMAGPVNDRLLLQAARELLGPAAVGQP
jgi:hypothetical protein